MTKTADGSLLGPAEKSARSGDGSGQGFNDMLRNAPPGRISVMPAGTTNVLMEKPPQQLIV
jgi:hypothetical protein